MILRPTGIRRYSPHLRKIFSELPQALGNTLLWAWSKRMHGGLRYPGVESGMQEIFYVSVDERLAKRL